MKDMSKSNDFTPQGLIVSTSNLCLTTKSKGMQRRTADRLINPIIIARMMEKDYLGEFFLPDRLA